MAVAPAGQAPPPAHGQGTWVTAPRGEIVVPLDEAEVRERARALRKAGVDAIAVCLLHAYLNPAHEQRIKQILQEECPDAYLSVSSEVLPLYREFERFSTTCLNAYVGPRVGSYVGRLESGLKDAGLARGVRLMQSSGGMTTADSAAGGPVNLMMSGPVGGSDRRHLGRQDGRLRQRLHARHRRHVGGHRRGRRRRAQDAPPARTPRSATTRP